jgi:DNA-binding GntR family transcriptional regulator
MAKDGPEGGYDAARLSELIARERPRHATAQDLVLEALRAAVLEGVLPPGSRLRQEDLAAAFETSRIPVRDALRALAYEGLARSEPRRGFTVRALDGDQLEEIYDLRIVLECHAIRLAMPLVTDADQAALVQLHDALVGARTPDEQLALRERFHVRFYAIAARPRLLRQIARLWQEVGQPLRRRAAEHTPAAHEAFWAAILAGDAELAATELTAHYRRVVALLHRFIREAKEPLPIGRL